MKNPPAVNDPVSVLLAHALEQTRYARACISQNRGQEKEEAREAYEACIADELCPALTRVIDLATGDLDARDVERLSELVLKFIMKRGL